MKIQLKRSNVLENGNAKSPTAAQMEYGELAVNYNSTDPVIFIKDSSNEIIRLTNNQEVNDGGINVNAGVGLTASGDNGTANQSINTTRTLEVDADWLTGFITEWAGAGSVNDGQININAGLGILASGNNATANQQTNTTRVLAVKADPNGGLHVTNNGVKVIANPNGGLNVTSEGIKAVAKPNSGISVSADGIGVVLKPAGGLIVGSDGIGVEFPPFPEPAYGDGLKYENNQVDLVLSPSNNGLNIDSTGISVRIDPGYAIDVTDTGIRFGDTWTNIPQLPEA